MMEPQGKIEQSLVSNPVIQSPYFWYAIYCRSRREKELEKDLLEDGLEAYLQKIKKQYV
jgi:hypothetical protein